MLKAVLAVTAPALLLFVPLVTDHFNVWLEGHRPVWWDNSRRLSSAFVIEDDVAEANERWKTPGTERSLHEQDKAARGGEHGADRHEQGHQHDQGYASLFFLFGGFGLGCYLQFAQERWCKSIPYTAMLFVAGMLLSVIHHVRTDSHWSYWPTWYTSIDMWQNIDPHLVFYVFLPALIFAEAMKLNIKLGKRLFSQVLILACPGVILGSIMTAAFSRLVLPYHWPWSMCLVFGSILSATDPVAVVALFNTLGVSPRLTMLISGESLLNDGTAIVLFNLMMIMWKGHKVTTLFAICYFLQMTVVATLLGVGLAMLALSLVFGAAETRYHSDAMIQVAVTVACCFLCFFMAESELATSGVITVVSAGVVFSYFAWPRFASKETIRTVWEFIELLGNTIVFLLAGLLFGHRLLTRKDEAHIDVWDVFWLLLLYVALTIIRFVMMCILWPFLNQCGQKITWQEMVVMTWSGLRGAVGLVLAINVDRSADIEVGSRILFHVGGMALLTILVNATLSAPLLRLLGFTKTPEVEGKCIEHFERITDEHARMALAGVMESRDPDSRFAGADVNTAFDHLPTLSHEPSPELSQRHLGARLQTYREMFMRAVQHHYWEDIDQGLIPRTSRVTRILLYSTDAALDNPRAPLKDWNLVQESLHEVSAAPSFLGNLFFTWPFSDLKFLAEAFPSEKTVLVWHVFAGLAFIEAHKRARTELPQHLLANSVLGQQIQTVVAQESLAQCSHAQAMLDDLPDEAVQVGKSRMLAGQLLQLQALKVADLQETGLLSEKGAGHILHRIQDAQRHLANMHSYEKANATICGGENEDGSSSEDSEAFKN